MTQTVKEHLETLAKNVIQTVIDNVKSDHSWDRHYIKLDADELEQVLKDAFDNHIPPIVASWTFKF